MARKMSKHAFGTKEGIENAKTQKQIDEYDILFLDNGEIGWLDKTNNTVINTPRTQKPHVLKGTTFGALNPGDTIPAGKSLDEIMAMATQKSIPASYLKPTVALSNHGGTNSGAVEAGTSITPKVTATFTKNDAGDLTGITVKKGGVNVKEGTASPLNYDGEPIVIGDETISFSATATYKEGTIKNDNLGNPSPNGHIVAGTIASSNYSFIGQRNSFWGSGVGTIQSPTSNDIRKLANKRLNIASGTKISLKVETGQQYIIFALPEPRTLTQVIYDDLGDKGMLSSFVKTTVQVADARGEANGLKNYNCYTYNLSVPAAAPMNFTFVIG